MKWFRSHHGAPFDTKLAVVARRANVTRGNAASVWWAILDHASSHTPRGFIGELTAEEVAAAFDYDESDVQTILDAMREKGLLIAADGKLCGWDEKQISREDNSRDRVALHRARKRGVTQSNAEAEPATLGNGQEGEGEKDSPHSPPQISRKDILAMVEFWNGAAALHGLAQVEKITKPREAKCRARIVDAGGVEGFKAAIEKLVSIPGMLGKNERDWTADFDFLLQESSFTKLREGSYDNWGKTPGGGGPKPF